MNHPISLEEGKNGKVLQGAVDRLKHEPLGDGFGERDTHFLLHPRPRHCLPAPAEGIEKGLAAQGVPGGTTPSLYTPVPPHCRKREES